MARLQSGGRLVLVAVLAAILTASGLALAGAVSLQDLANPKLTPSGVPQLLGPIAQAGRKGWECMPERAAAAKLANVADLPADGPSP